MVHDGFHDHKGLFRWREQYVARPDGPDRPNNPIAKAAQFLDDDERQAARKRLNADMTPASHQGD